MIKRWRLTAAAVAAAVAIAASPALALTAPLSATPARRPMGRSATAPAIGSVR